MLVTALAALRRSRHAGIAALAMGVVLVVWGVVETLTIGYQGTGQLILLGVFVVAPALPLLVLAARPCMETPDLPRWTFPSQNARPWLHSLLSELATPRRLDSRAGRVYSLPVWAATRPPRQRCTVSRAGA
jgi:hypothetical protein